MIAEIHTAVSSLAETVARRAHGSSAPCVVAIDGRSGAGKSTLAAALAGLLDAAVIAGDDFFAGGTALRDDDAPARAAACIDWTRQRDVLAALRAGRAATWRAFDWDAFDGRLCDAPTIQPPRPVVILEGVYAARPELAELIDLRVLVVLDDAKRAARLIAREGTIGPWERQWHTAEAHYFGQVMPPERFDLIFAAGAHGWHDGASCPSERR
jgi:uridine kinase